MLTPRSCFRTHVPHRLCRDLAGMAAAEGSCRPANVGILAMDMYFPKTFVQQVCGYKLCISMCRRRAHGRQPHALLAVCSWRHDNLDSRFLNTQTGGAAVPPPPIIYVAHCSYVCVYVHAYICVDACTCPRLVADCLAGGPGEGRWMRGKVYRGPRPEQNGVCGRQVYNGGVPMALNARTD